MIARQAATIRAHGGWWSCEIVGAPGGRMSAIVSADTRSWEHVAVGLAETGEQVVLVEVPPAASLDDLLDGLACAARFLPGRHRWAGDGIAAAVLVTVAGEQRLRTTEIVMVAPQVPSTLTARFEAALRVLDARVHEVSGVEARGSALAAAGRDQFGATAVGHRE